MIHPDLLNALKRLSPEITDGMTLDQAWRILNPERKIFQRQSFWGVLQATIIFAKSAEKQKRLAEYIFRHTPDGKLIGRPIIPSKIVTKPVFVPAPNPL